MKPSTGQISNADIIYLEFAIPILQSSREPLNGNIVFQSILHGITRGHYPRTPYHAAVLCGAALVLAYTREILTQKDIPYPEGGLDELKRELEHHKQEHILQMATRLSQILAPYAFLEHMFSWIGILSKMRKRNIHDLAQKINELLVAWG